MTNDSTTADTDDEPDYDVVLDTLQKHHDKLMGVDKHINEYTPFGIMQQIRMKQCHELNMAMKVWQDYRKANPEEFGW
jgi:hypothetical protein